MLAKYWKKILLVILIIACLINIISKLLKVVSFNNTLDTIKDKFLTSQGNEESKKE